VRRRVRKGNLVVPPVPRRRIKSSRTPVGTTAPSRPNVGSRRSEPPRRATPSCPLWQLATVWDLVCFSAAGSSHRERPWGLQLHPDPCGFATIRATPPCDAELSIGSFCRGRRFLISVSSIPWFHHRVARGDYSPNAAPARVTEPPRRATPSGDQERKWGTLGVLTLPALSTLRDPQRQSPSGNLLLPKRPSLRRNPNRTTVSSETCQLVEPPNSTADVVQKRYRAHSIARVSCIFRCCLYVPLLLINVSFEVTNATGKCEKHNDAALHRARRFQARASPCAPSLSPHVP
jgi:hypothetical protein